MNCTHVRELLPLFVGNDLEEKRAKLVTAHVQSCVQCAVSADEYRETRRLLERFAPPPFDEAAYAGIRQRVLREIEREAARPTVTQSVASLFGPRIRWAVATLLVLGVSLLVILFNAERKNDQQLAGSRDSVIRTQDERADGVTASLDPASSEVRGGPPAPNTGPEATLAESVDRTDGTRHGQSSGTAAGGRKGVAANAPDTATAVDAFSEDRKLAEPAAVAASDPLTEKILRVEMQTNDPNIRIIWFSHPRTTTEDSPGHSSEESRS